ncbi:MAG TPA: alpha/beta hydrolase-fold protein [Candidatus Saccharimonadales bacterium]|nr:alpha/beta hydrolase-fold protein [Candidatus Saccharimonadales bacterium]
MNNWQKLGFAVALVLALGVPAPGAEKLSAVQLIALSKAEGPGLGEGIVASFAAKDLQEGTAWSANGGEFFFATEATAKPVLLVDGIAGPEMKSVEGTMLWFAVAEVQPVGRLHSFYYVLDGAASDGKGGRRFGGRLDLPAFGPLSYQQAGVPAGTLSAKIVHTSKIYDGMKAEYWIYVPAQYEARTPAALMVFQDGEGYLDRNGRIPALNVIDNLIAQKKIPVVIGVFINPGDIEGSPGTPTYRFVKGYSETWKRTLKDSMRSTLYDTVSDRYARYLRDEILADVSAKYNIRKDAYSRAITGSSSGAICAFNAAWQMPAQFGRVISWIGTFTSLQWKEDPRNPEGGQDYPDKVLRETHRNIRVWLQDGAEDMELATYGSWPLANIRMANALKLKEYDFHFSFGQGTHNQAQGAVEFPEEMVWLWRDYDAGKTEQNFLMETSERAQPLFRVAIANREASADSVH